MNARELKAGMRVQNFRFIGEITNVGSGTFSVMDERTNEEHLYHLTDTVAAQFMEMPEDVMRVGVSLTETDEFDETDDTDEVRISREDADQIIEDLDQIIEDLLEYHTELAEEDPTRYGTRGSALYVKAVKLLQTRIASKLQ